MTEAEQLDRLIDGGATREQRTRFDTLDEMLRPVGKRIDDDGNGNRVERPLHRQFLLVEPEGQGRMVEVLGELEEARKSRYWCQACGTPLTGRAPRWTGPS